MKTGKGTKNFFYRLCISLSVVWGSAICPATVFAQANCACADCGRSCNDIKTMGHKPGFSCYTGSASAQGSSNQGLTPGGGQDMKSQMLETILGAALQSLFASPDNSKQEQLDKEKKLADEQARLKSLQEWQRLQYEENMKKKIGDAARLKQGEEMLSQMQNVGSGGTLKLLSVGNGNSGIKAMNPEDELVRQAREQLQAAEQEISLAQQAERDGLNKKEQLGKEYENLQSR